MRKLSAREVGLPKKKEASKQQGWISRPSLSDLYSPTLSTHHTGYKTGQLLTLLIVPALPVTHKPIEMANSALIFLNN